MNDYYHGDEFERDELAALRARAASDAAPEPLYACRDCGVMRTKAEGGTVFTVCDECWDKHHKKPAPRETAGAVARSASDAALIERLTKALTDAAISLETLSLAGGRDKRAEFLQDMIDVRGYANSRHQVARSALADAIRAEKEKP